jgi:hypothetical protein
MTITAICGDIGSGKSFKQLHYGLQQVNKKRKRLVTNFGLNYAEFRRYAGMMRYGWLAHIIDTKQIATMDCIESLGDILKYSDSLVLLDEAGIFLNTREFSKTPKKLLMDLAQSRKFGCDLVYCAQFDDQVDKQFRMLTQYFIQCQASTIYDKRLRRPRMVTKNYFIFTADKYHTWAGNSKDRANFVKTWMQSFDYHGGFLSAADKQLFNCFDSFTRLDEQSAAVTDMGLSASELEDVYSLSRIKKHAFSAALKRDTKTYFFGALEVSPNYPKSRAS